MSESSHVTGLVAFLIVITAGIFFLVVFGALTAAGIVIALFMLLAATKWAGFKNYLVVFILPAILLLFAWNLVFVSAAVSFVTALGTVMFLFGFIFSVLMYDFVGSLSGRLVGIGVVLLFIGALLIIMPFAPGLFL